MCKWSESRASLLFALFFLILTQNISRILSIISVTCQSISSLLFQYIDKNNWTQFSFLPNLLVSEPAIKYSSLARLSGDFFVKWSSFSLQGNHSAVGGYLFWSGVVGEERCSFSILRSYTLRHTSEGCLYDVWLSSRDAFVCPWIWWRRLERHFHWLYRLERRTRQGRPQ